MFGVWTDRVEILFFSLYRKEDKDEDEDENENENGKYGGISKKEGVCLFEQPCQRLKLLIRIIFFCW